MPQTAIDIEAELREGLRKPVQSATDIETELREGLGDIERLRAESVGQGTLGPPGLKNPVARFAVGQANNREEAIAAFQKVYPKGELQFVPSPGDEAKGVGGTTMVFREDPSQPFRLVDAEFLEGGGGEIIGDVIDFFSEDFGAIVGEIATTARTRGTNLIPLLMRAAAGAMMGEGAQQLGQTALGLQTDRPSDVATRTVVQGAFGAGGATVGRALATVVGFEPLRGVLHMTPGAKRAERSAERTGIPLLLAPQVTDNPLIRKLGGQAGAVLPTLERYMNRQKEASVQFLRRMRDPKNANALRENLSDFLTKQRKKVLSEAMDLRTPTKMSKAGLELNKGVADYDDAASALIDGLYRDARNIETPEFDLSPLGSAIELLTKGDQAATAAGGTIRARGPLHPTVQAVIDDIQKLDTKLPTTINPDGSEVTATDQLRYFQQRLYDIATLPPHAVADSGQREAAREAKMLLGGLNEVLANPKNASPDFLAAWKTAQTEAKNRFDTLEKLIVIKAARTETPAILAQRLATPGQVDNLKVLKAAVPSERFTALQDAFKTQLLENAEKSKRNLSDALDAFDQETLDLLMSPNEQGIYRFAGAALKRLDQSGIERALERQTQFGELVGDLVERSDTAGIDEFAKMIERGGGKNSPLGRSVRAGIIDRIYRDVTHFEKGLPRIDNKALTETLRRYSDRGVLKFLDVGDVKGLVDLRRVLDFVISLEEVGGGIQGGEAVAGIRTLQASALITILEHVGTGRMLLGEGRIGGAFNRILLGRGPVKDPGKLRKFGRQHRDTLEAMSRILVFAGDDLEEAPRAGTE